MSTETIEYLAYLIKEAKRNNAPKPIVFLGAGASKSGGIPDADEIVNKILNDFSDNPKIKSLKEEDKKYSILMDMITPAQRNSLLKEMIDKAKINVTHIYLAQMMKQGYIDYFLTVNFDNLMLRALALFNIFPPTYDISILKDLTTSSLHPQSITYLHGQHTGLWLLNTQDEMDKPKEIIPIILNQIKNGRTWIILGYSGSDPIFEHIIKLGRFDNGLYWIGYKENSPAKIVTEGLLNKPNSNAHLIQGYDSDSFCLKLNKELGCDEPIIFDTPFTFLHNVQNNIVDIDNSDTYKNVKERLDLSKKMVNDAIGKYEDQLSSEMSFSEITQSNLKKEIINAIIKESYLDADTLFNKSINIEDNEINELLSKLYYNWGVDLTDYAKNLQGEEKKKYLHLVNDKYEKATTINPKDDSAYNNWGTNLSNIAETLKGEEQKKYYQLAFDKYEKAAIINPKNDAYYNWGTNLGTIAKSLKGEEQKKYYQLAFDKYEKATTINPKNDAYYNWGKDLGDFAETLKGEEQKKYYQLAFDKYEKATTINPKDDSAYHNWGTNLGALAKNLKGEEQKKYYQLAFDKYEKAANINPKDGSTYNNWGTDLAAIAKKEIDPQKTDLLKESLEKLKIASNLNNQYYNLACVYALLNQKDLAIQTLSLTMKNDQINAEEVIKDEDWKEYLNDEDFINLLNKYQV